MFRCIVSALRQLRPLKLPYLNATSIIQREAKAFSTLNTYHQPAASNGISYYPSLETNRHILEICNNMNQSSVRTVTKFSLKKGKRKTVKAVIKRFYRLDWGGWIRPKVGRKKKLWKKSAAQKRRLRQHVFCNASQTTLLDKMVTKYWKRPKYYVDDPYEPYHCREEYWITRKKPVVRD